MELTSEEFWRILHDVPESKPLFYRLYHDDQGHPIVYSMEDLPGTYIEVDQDTYNQNNYHVRVIAGQLKKLERSSPISKLKPGSEGIACHPQDVCVIVDSIQAHMKWSIHHED